MFRVLKTEGRARRGEFSCAHGGLVRTWRSRTVPGSPRTRQRPWRYHCPGWKRGHPGSHQGGRQRPRLKGAQMSDRAVQHLPPPSPAWGRRGAGPGRTAQDDARSPATLGPMLGRSVSFVMALLSGAGLPGVLLQHTVKVSLVFLLPPVQPGDAMFIASGIGENIQNEGSLFRNSDFRAVSTA